MIRDYQGSDRDIRSCGKLIKARRSQDERFFPRPLMFPRNPSPVLNLSKGQKESST